MWPESRLHPQVTGMDKTTLPLSFLTRTLFTLASLAISLNFSINFSGDTWKTSFLNPACVPHDEQYFAFGGSSEPHSKQFAITVNTDRTAFTI